MSLSVDNKICLLALCNLPVNLLFSQPSLVDGYITTPCTECHAPISTRNGEPIPERCSRPSCLKLESFPLACLAVSLKHGGFKTIHYKKKLSLVLEKTPNLRRILPVDSELGFWIPRRIGDKRRFFKERQARNRIHLQKGLCYPPCWTGEARPQKDTVPLEDVVRSLDHGDVRTLTSLSYPFRAMSQSVSFLKPAPHTKTRQELGEIVVVKTPFNNMPPEQQMQHRDHEALMRVLGGMRMQGDRQNSLYDVIVLGKSVREVSEARGINAGSLAVTVSRVRAKMY